MLTYLLDSRSKTPLYEQLYCAIRHDIQTGALAGGARLPSKRQFASHLRVSPITIETAYGQLLAEGYIRSEPRQGYFVQEELAMIAPLALQHTNPPANLPTAPVRQSVEPIQPAKSVRPAKPVKSVPSVCCYDFRTNIVDTECFPFSTWARLSRRILSEYSEGLLRATDPGGVYALREQLCRYLSDFRGFTVSAEHILIGAGSEYLIPLIFQLLGRNRVYALENPGYRKLYQIFAVNGVTVHPLPLDENGLCVDALLKSDATVVYVTPSHHFPLGTVMSAARRMELLRWVQAAPERYIIEDDYDSEFRYSTRPIPALGALAHTGRVVYVNTFAKSLAPSLRIGYLVLPDTLMKRFRQIFSLYSSTVPSFEQYTLAEFMRSGGFERHISRSRKVYQSRRDALLSALQQAFDFPYTVSGEEAGLHLLLSVQNGMDEDTLIARAQQQGVRVYGLSHYYMPPLQPKQATLVLGYAGLSERDIAQAVQRLRDAWRTEG